MSNFIQQFLIKLSHSVKFWLVPPSPNLSSNSKIYVWNYFSENLFYLSNLSIIESIRQKLQQMIFFTLYKSPNWSHFFFVWKKQKTYLSIKPFINKNIKRSSHFFITTYLHKVSLYKAWNKEKLSAYNDTWIVW